MPLDLGPDKLIPIGQAAAMCGVSVDTFRVWTDRGDVEVIRTLGGHRRYRRSEVEALREKLTAKAAS